MAIVSTGFRHPLGDGTLTEAHHSQLIPDVNNGDPGPQPDGIFDSPGFDDNDYFIATEHGSDESHNGYSYHLGEDWNGSDFDDLGDAVFTASAGKVEQVGYLAGLGNYITIVHKLPYKVTFNGITTDTIVTLYAHLDNDHRAGKALVSEGQEIPSNYQIGNLGGSGGNFDPHLHFELRLGTQYRNTDGYLDSPNPEGWADPTDFIEAHRTFDPVAGTGPDLIIENVSVSESSVALGDTLTVTYNVTNIGDEAAASHFTRFVFSEDAVLSTDDVSTLDIVDAPLAPGESRPFTSIISTADVPNVGTYNLILVADHTDTIDESDEDNNAAAPIVVQLSDDPGTGPQHMTARALVPIQMPDLTIWFGALVEATATSIVIADATRRTEYSGNFEYGLGGILSGGTVTGISEYRNGTQIYEITGAQVDAIALATAVQSGDIDLAASLAFAGNDSLIGSSGDDETRSYAGDDTGHGGAGNDTGYGGSGNDLAYGETGDDFLFGESGLDTLVGGPGNDFLAGGTDNDSLDGGDDNDELFGGGSGEDTLIGGRGSDFLFGENGDDLLEGGDGFDLLNGGTDDDTLIGGNGNDRLLGNLGNDSLEGDAGNDTLFGGPSGNDILKGGDNDDQLFGETGKDILFGEDGNDTLNGGSNDDTLLGGNGDDSLEGGSGNDQLFGGPTGADTLKGGQGSDFLFAESADDVLEGGDGFDLMNGGAGDDVMRGGNGGDQIIGNLGNDLIEGDAGDDNIFGSAGNDTIAGGTGNDTLRGELGADTFIFEDGFGTDEIIGFQLTGGDVIDLALVTGITSFTDLQTNHLSQDGADAVITDGVNTIRLVGIDENDLLADNFEFLTL